MLDPNGFVRTAATVSSLMPKRKPSHNFTWLLEKPGATNAERITSAGYSVSDHMTLRGSLKVTRYFRQDSYLTLLFMPSSVIIRLLWLAVPPPGPSTILREGGGVVRQHVKYVGCS